LVPKSVTLNDLERPYGYFVAFSPKVVDFRANHVRRIEMERDLCRHDSMLTVVCHEESRDIPLAADTILVDIR